MAKRPVLARATSACTRVSRRAMAPELCDARASRAARLSSHQLRNRLGLRKGRGGACLSVVHYPVSLSVGWAKARSAVPTLYIPLGLTAWASLRSAPPYKIEGGGTPANAGLPPHLAMRRALLRSALVCRRSTAVLAQGSISSQGLSFRPGFLGRGLHGRYPPSPVPVQGSTSRPGHNAGRHDAQAARERTANPPAGTALAAMTRCASAPRPSRSEDCDVAVVETIVKGKVT
jgi:hypothetical protein